VSSETRTLVDLDTAEEEEHKGWKRKP